MIANHSGVHKLKGTDAGLAVDFYASRPWTAGKKLSKMKGYNRGTSMWTLRNLSKLCLVLGALLLAGSAFAQDLKLADLVDEALRNNPEIQAFGSGIEGARQRIPQAKSLPDPMVMFGYQNEGFSRYTLGEEQGAQWMFGLSQQFLFPGKRGLKGHMARLDAESREAMLELVKLRTVSRVRELYWELFLAYKNIDLLRERQVLFARVEDLALARYSTGKGMQQEVLMAQTEKYMLLEKEAMFRQKITSLDAMLKATIGRDGGTALGRPGLLPPQPFPYKADDTVEMAVTHSPEIKSRIKMIEAAETKVRMAKKEFFPDYSINAGYYKRSGDFMDMWSLTSTINIPIYFFMKQAPALSEAKAGHAQAKQELEAAKLMITAAIRDNVSMIKSADTLMDLYKNGLIPKNAQDVDLALSGYATGRTEAIVVLSRLKTLLEYETQYWTQFTEREKAVARIHAITAGLDTMPGGEKK
ncbi:MAG: TolC family protein [Deltaproteobacteria bacterium]|nr:TolC family protein [Deltaproteobacteria bacterium]